MTIQQIYTQFLIPQNLQQHMLRVAALAQIILENWTGKKPDTEAIVIAAALHDIAKPVTFDLAKQAEYGLSLKEIQDLANLQKMIKTKYSSQEHQALLGIAQDLGYSALTVDILDNDEWEFIPRLLSDQQIEPLIMIYADMRIGWNGILSLSERLAKLQARTAIANLEVYQKNGPKLEEMIQEKTTIDITQITNQDLESRFT